MLIVAVNIIDVRRLSRRVNQRRIVDCREGCGPTPLPFVLQGRPAPVTLDVHLKDRGVVNESINGGKRHGGVREDPVPFTEGLVGGDQEGAALVSGRDELEQNAGFSLTFGDVGQIVEDEQVELVEL